MVNPVQQLIEEFNEAFLDKFGTKAPIVRGKDHKLAKLLLERYELDQLKGWAWKFFTVDDAFIKQSGYSFGVFSACLGKVITAKAHGKNDKFQGLRDFIDGA